MKRHLGTVAAALFLVLGTFTVTERWVLHRQHAVQAQPVVAVDPTADLAEVDVRTGDAFWGLHLDGVIPCASMLVKGGGHLVIISPQGNHEARCYFHIKDTKVVELGAVRFRLQVVAPDRIHVIREPAEQVAVASR